MCQIISLESRAPARRRAEPVEGGAEILFFLGVRYMRWEDASPLRAGPKKPSGTGAKKRKRPARA